MIDIFDILGPIMIGPSSSHTAGAVRIGRMGYTLLGEDVARAVIQLHGSFAQTGRGHGTDKALLAGLMGMKPDDGRIVDAYAEAEKAGMQYVFETVELADAHPNTVKLELTGANGKHLSMTASSVGGGAILVKELDGIQVQFDGHAHTLIVRNDDARGALAEVTQLLSWHGINVGELRLSRRKKGGDALMVIETDQPVEEDILHMLRALPGIQSVTYYDKRKEETEDEA